MLAYVTLQREGLSHLRERAADIPGAWADRDAVTYVRDAQRAGDIDLEAEDEAGGAVRTQELTAVCAQARVAPAP